MFQHEEDDVEWEEEDDVLGEARPGTTKRKQYYAKKVGIFIYSILEDLTRVIISYEIYLTSLWRV